MNLLIWIIQMLWKMRTVNSADVVCCLVFQYDPGFQEDPSQPFSDSDEDVNDTDGQFVSLESCDWQFLLVVICRVSDILHAFSHMSITDSCDPTLAYKPTWSCHIYILLTVYSSCWTFQCMICLQKLQSVLQANEQFAWPFSYSTVTPIWRLMYKTTGYTLVNGGITHQKQQICEKGDNNPALPSSTLTKCQCTAE